MTESVGPGQTLALHGKFAAGQTLVAESGNAAELSGALIVVGVHSTAANEGTLSFEAGPAETGLYGATGATLALEGTLTNDGLIALAGGATAIRQGGAVTGAQLDNRGVLVNLGTIDVGTARERYATYDNGAATLRDNGTLTNAGRLNVNGDTARGGLAGGSLIVAGLLTNTGFINVSGGYGKNGGGIVRIGTSATLVNNGQLWLSGSSYYKDLPRSSATLELAGVLINTGTLRVAQGNPGAQLVIAASGQLTNAGSLEIYGGNNGGDYSFGGLYDPGIVVDDGVLANTGTLVVSASGFGGMAGGSLSDAGVLSNSGLLTVGGGYFFGGYALKQNGLVTVSGVLTNSATLQLDGGAQDGFSYSSGPGATLLDTGSVTNTGAIVLGGGGSGRYDGSRSGAATLDVSGALTNQGQIVAESGISKVAGSYARGGLLEVSGALTNDGTISVAIQVKGSADVADGADEMNPNGRISTTPALSSALSATSADPFRFPGFSFAPMGFALAVPSMGQRRGALVLATRAFALSKHSCLAS